MADQPDVPSWAQQPDTQAAPAAAPSWASQQPTAAPTSAPTIQAPPQVPMAGSENAPAYAAVQQKIFNQTQPGAMMAVVKQAFSTDEPIGMSEETRQHLADIGVFNDFAKGQDDFIKNFNEAILRPAAAVGDMAMRGLNAALVLPMGTVGAAVDKFDEQFGLYHESAETNAMHAQDFANYIYLTSGFSPENIPLAAKSAEAAMPPSGVREAVMTPKPWVADVKTEAAEGETAAATAPEAKVPPPINNLPATTAQPAAQAEEAAAGAKQNLPASPVEPIQHESPIIDGTGNLNLNYIRADQDTKDILGNVSQAYAEKYGTEVPHVETVESANQFFDEAMKQVTNGIPDVLGNYARGDAISRDLLWTARQMSVQLATNFGRLAKTAAATGAPEDAAAAQEAFTKMVQVVGPIRHEMTAEAGRILESMKIPVGENLPALADGSPVITEQAAQKLAGMNINDALRIAGSLDTPQAVAKFVADVQKPSFTDMGLYYVFNNFLSGPITHLAYTASWGVQTVIRAGLETPIASAVGKIQDMLGKTVSPAEVNALQAERVALTDKLLSAGSTQGVKMSAVDAQAAEARLEEINNRLKGGTTVMPQEAQARFFGIGEGALDSIRAFGRALKTADVQMLPGEMKEADAAAKEATAAALKEGKTPEEASAAGQAAYQDKAMNFGNPIVQYGKMIKNPAGSMAVQAAGQVIGVPMRVIAAIHSLQKFSGYAESMNALAYRQAASEGWEGTLRGADALGQRIAQIKNNPTPEMMKQATEESKYAALMGESGKVGKLFQNLANANGWTRMVVPFSKVVTNLTSQKILERTPVGLLGHVVRDNILGKNGNAAQATQIAKMLTGSTLLTGGAYLAAQGVNHGWGSDDPKERAFQYLAGRPPYSITIGDVNLPHRFFGVAAGSLSLGADLHDISQVMDENDEHWNDWMAIMGHAIHYMGRDILSENALTGPANLYNAINDKENAAKNFVPNAIASAFVPYSTFQSQMTQRFIDPIMRQTTGPGTETYDNIIQTIQSRMPFVSSQLMPKVDILGNPMRRDSDPSWAANDPVMQAMDHLGIYPSAVPNKLWGVPLDEKQQADYATLAGKLFYNQVLAQTQNPNWVRIPEQSQANIIQGAIKASRAQARSTMSLLYPQIVKDSHDMKMEALHQYDDDSQ